MAASTVAGEPDVYAVVAARRVAQGRTSNDQAPAAVADDAGVAELVGTPLKLKKFTPSLLTWNVTVAVNVPVIWMLAASASLTSKYTVWLIQLDPQRYLRRLLQ